MLDNVFETISAENQNITWTEQEEMIWMLLIFTISNCGFTLARKYSSEKTNFHILSLVVKNDFTGGPFNINKTDENNYYIRFYLQKKPKWAFSV